MNKKPNRRQFLQSTFYGASISLALPWLPSLAPRSAWANTTGGKKNLVIMYMPDGTFAHRLQNGRVVKDASMSEWYTPTGSFAGQGALPSMLKPLENHRNDFSIVSGIRTYETGTQCNFGHAKAISSYLTGIKLTENICSNSRAPNESVDQQIARHLLSSSGGTNFEDVSAAIKMTNEGNGGEVRNGANAVWGHNISFRNGGAAPSVLDPNRLFRQFFGEGLTGDAIKQSKYKKTLDILLPDIKSKLSKASPSDKKVLQRFLSSYEGIARDLDAANLQQPENACTFATKPGDDLRFGNQFFAKYDERMNLNIRMMAAAMACGKQRIFTLLMESEAADREGYGSIVGPEFYHSAGGYTANKRDLDGSRPHIGMAHYDSGNEAEKNKKIVLLTSVTHYRLSKFRMMIDEAKRMGVFDNSLITIGHSIADGQDHSMIDPPLLVAGGAGGLRRGQHIKLDTQSRNSIYQEGDTIALSEFWNSVKKIYGLNSGRSSRADSVFSSIG